MPQRILLLVLLLCAGKAPGQQREFLFEPGSAPFVTSHASTLVELDHGNLLAAWFGGTAEGAPDVAIWSARRVAGHWSAPMQLVREEGVACWNPVLFHAGGRLWLYYKFGPSPQTWTAGRLVSHDEGRSWSAPEHLPAGLLGPIRTKPLVLPDGTVVSGSSVESYRSWAVWIERGRPSAPPAETSRIGPIVIPRTVQAQTPNPVDSRVPGSLIQPSIVSLGGHHLRGHHLRLYARSTESTGRVAAADSFNDGRTWTQAHPLDVPNPNSGIDAVALCDGRIVLIYNNTTSGRTPLNLAVSRDGEHFTPFFTLEDQPGEYSYPALIQSADGSLLMTYTWNRKSIRFAQIPLAGVPR